MRSTALMTWNHFKYYPVGNTRRFHLLNQYLTHTVKLTLKPDAYHYNTVVLF